MLPGVKRPPTLVDADRADLRRHAGATPFVLRHRVAAHPALRREVLAELADRRPPATVEHHLADLPLLLPDGRADGLARSPGEVVAGIEANGCWLIMWHVQGAAPYDGLVHDCLTPLREVLEHSEGGVTEEDASILVASPAAVVPAHVDREHVLLLQIEGTKRVTVGHHTDAAQYHRQVERRFAPVSLNVDVLPDCTTTFTLGPGEALYIPAFAIHWVEGGDDASVSLSCSVRTAVTARREAVYRCNARLRRLHIDPRAPGVPGSMDGAKVAALNGWTWTRPRVGRARLAIIGLRHRVARGDPPAG